MMSVGWFLCGAIFGMVPGFLLGRYRADSLRQEPEIYVRPPNLSVGPVDPSVLAADINVLTAQKIDRLRRSGL